MYIVSNLYVLYRALHIVTFITRGKVLFNPMNGFINRFA